MVFYCGKQKLASTREDIDGNALAYGRKSSILARNKAAVPIA